MFSNEVNRLNHTRQAHVYEKTRKTSVSDSLSKASCASSLNGTLPSV